MHGALRHLPALLLKRRPAHLTFFVTRRCNARCPFCFYADARDRKGGAPELSLAEVRKVAASMGPLLWVLFSGGEPFLREDLAALGQAFHDANGAGFLTCPTNGLLPETIEDTTEELLRRCPRSVVVVKVSLDGVGADHDRLRATPGGFDRALRTCERLARLARHRPRLELGVNTVFCRENQGRMDRLVDFVATLDGVRSHTLTVARGDATAGAFADVDLEAYRFATARLEARWRRRFHRFAGGGLKAAQDRVQHRLVRETLLAGRRPLPCSAGRLAVVLSETGELWACEGRRGDPLGDVRSAGYDVQAVLRFAAARRAREEIATGGCGCAHECNLLVDVLSSPRTYPALLREWARLRLGRAEAGRAEGACAPCREDGSTEERRQFA